MSTAPRLEAVPFVQAVTNLPNRIKLIWRPHPDFRLILILLKEPKVMIKNLKKLQK